MIPVVAARRHVDVRAGVANHQHSVERRFVIRFGQRGVDIRLERDVFAPAKAFIGGNHEAAAASFDAPGQGFGREAAEDDRMDRAKTRAGKHGEHAFHDHRHVDRYAIALADADSLERIGHGDDLAVQLPIGQRASRGSGIVRLENQRGPVAKRFQVAVHRIVAQVQLAIGEPGDVDRIEGPFAGLGGKGRPIEAFRLVEPELVRLLDRSPVQLLILFRGAVGCMVGF